MARPTMRRAPTTPPPPPPVAGAPGRARGAAVPRRGGHPPAPPLPLLPHHSRPSATAAAAGTPQAPPALRRQLHERGLSGTRAPTPLRSPCMWMGGARPVPWAPAPDPGTPRIRQQRGPLGVPGPRRARGAVGRHPARRGRGQAASPQSPPCLLPKYFGGRDGSTIRSATLSTPPPPPALTREASAPSTPMVPAAGTGAADGAVPPSVVALAARALRHLVARCPEARRLAAPALPPWPVPQDGTDGPG